MAYHFQQEKLLLNKTHSSEWGPDCNHPGTVCNSQWGGILRVKARCEDGDLPWETGVAL